MSVILQCHVLYIQYYNNNIIIIMAIIDHGTHHAGICTSLISNWQTHCIRQSPLYYTLPQHVLYQ